ncbi:hypothetical protein [Granulicatella adiacens]|uniref:hypothetical protein n=1 Tax=Granulicatella adiacens TaxID=46124 RepID=UPI004029DF44
MPNEPLLTRKSYKEQLEKQNRELEELETRQERRDSRGRSYEKEEELYAEREEEVSQVHRTPKSGLKRYNHFLNVWLVSVIVILIIVIAIQMFF